MQETLAVLRYRAFYLAQIEVDHAWSKEIDAEVDVVRLRLKRERDLLREKRKAQRWS